MGFDLDFYGSIWLEFKISRIKNLLNIAFTDEALYREIMVSMGYSKNKTQFLALSLILPYSQIKNFSSREIVETALLFRSGLSDNKEELPTNFDLSLRMDRKVWVFRGVRPNNFPDKRMRNLSFLLYEAHEVGLFKYFKNKIEQQYSKIPFTPKLSKKLVRYIMNFNGFGEHRKLEMFFNIILPFFIVIFEREGKMELVEFLLFLFSTHPPLPDNSITKRVKSYLFKDLEKARKVVDSTRKYFGLIEFYKENFAMNRATAIKNQEVP